MIPLFFPPPVCVIGRLAQCRQSARELTKRINGRVILRRDKSVIADKLPSKTDHILFCPLTPLQRTLYDQALSSPEIAFLKRSASDCSCGSKRNGGQCCVRSMRDGRSLNSLVFPSISLLSKIANHPRLLRPALLESREGQANKEALLRRLCANAHLAHAHTVEDGRELEDGRDEPEDGHKHVDGEGRERHEDGHTHTEEDRREKHEDGENQRAKHTEAEHELEDGREAEYHRICDLLDHGALEDVCGKMRVLAKLFPVWRREKRKVLLFSQSTRTLNIIEKHVHSLHYNYSRLDGSTPVKRRFLISEDFNRNAAKFLFLISTKAGALGLNLASASVVVIFDPW
jgi:SNF2 family DNA or RNA helicase